MDIMYMNAHNIQLIINIAINVINTIIRINIVFYKEVYLKKLKC